MKKQFRIEATEGLPGDVLVEAHWDATLTVEREVPDPPKPKPKPGTPGTAIVDGVRTHGMIDEDGDFKYLYWDGDYVETTYENMRDLLGFETDSGTGLTQPQITREKFLKTLRSVDEQNGLGIDEEALGRLMVFSADRLGLR